MGSKPTRFTGKRVFITGGSSGIGKAIAAEFLDAGAHVCIAARGQARLEEALTELRTRARKSAEPKGGMEEPKATTTREAEREPAQIVTSLALDVGDREAVDAAAPVILERLGGPVDILINNAGVTYPAAILDTPPELFESIMRVNYLGTVHVTRALLPSMIAGGGGQIAIVSSLAGVIGIYGYTAYSASKFALAGFAESLRQDLLVHGIGVSVVFPPDTDTPMLAEENQIKPAQTHAIAGNVASLRPEFVARATLVGLAKRRHHIVPGFASQFSVFMARRFPGLTRWVLDAQLRRFERKRLAIDQGQPGPSQVPPTSQ